MSLNKREKKKTKNGGSSNPDHFNLKRRDNDRQNRPASNVYSLLVNICQLDEKNERSRYFVQAKAFKQQIIDKKQRQHSIVDFNGIYGLIENGNQIKYRTKKNKYKSSTALFDQQLLKNKDLGCFDQI